MSKDKKTNSKRVKINFDSFSAPSAKRTVIDYSKVFEEKKAREEEDLERYKKEVKEEELRIEKLSCPVCSNSKKRRFITAESNGVMGPGYHSRITNDYFICETCGIHFSDLNKKEIKQPYNSNNFLF
jgi:transposase-like protein